jgi:aspartate-semialdehyde dehydrogenase
MKRRSVAIVGATGIAGQQFVVALQEHPWFEITHLAASERSAGRSYLEALRDEKSGGVGWWCEGFPNEHVQRMRMAEARDLDAREVEIVFTAIESEPARELEPLYARSTPVISTASAFRYEDDVPIIIPGVNSAHAQLIERQKRERGWEGFIVPIPNCTTTGLAITLKPLYEAFGLKGVVMTSLQAMSGAGRRGGVLGLDIVDNVIPYISGEEEKVQKETRKILGSARDGRVEPAEVPVSATCTRVAVVDGHTESVFVSTERPCSVDAARETWRSYCWELDGLPSAPPEMIVLHEDPFRPQPRMDRDTHDGMATVVGRVRPDHVLPNGLKYVLLSHNTKMGAAKGAVLVAELLVRDGVI